MSDNAVSEFQKAQEIFQSGDYYSALELLQNIKKKNPKLNQVNEYIAYSLHSLNKYKHAIQYYLSVLENNPKHHKALYNKALCFYSLGQYMESKKDFLQLLQTDFPEEPLLKGLGMCEYALNNHERAIEYLLKSLVQNPDSKDSLYYLAWSYHITDQPANCVQTFDKYTELYPTDGIAHQIKGLNRIKMHNLHEGLDDIRKAASLFQQCGEVNRANNTQKIIESIDSMIAEEMQKQSSD